MSGQNETQHPAGGPGSMQSREGYRFSVPVEVFDSGVLKGLPGNAVHVYFYLRRCALGNDSAFPGEQTIADKCGMVIRTVRSSLQSLVDAGLITVDRGAINGRGNRYWIADVTKLVSEGVRTPATFVTNTGNFCNETPATFDPLSSSVEVSELSRCETPTPIDKTFTVQPNLTPTQAELQKRLRAETKGMSARPKPTGIPDGWQPSEATKQYAESKSIPLSELHGTVLKFVRHHASKGTRLVDFNPPFLTWIDNEATWRAEKHKPELPKPAERKHLVY